MTTDTHAPLPATTSGAWRRTVGLILALGGLAAIICGLVLLASVPAAPTAGDLLRDPFKSLGEQMRISHMRRVAHARATSVIVPGVVAMAGGLALLVAGRVGRRLSAALSRSCPRCGADNPRRAQFCRRCGTAVASPGGTA